jgi:hypothetical protein
MQLNEFNKQDIDVNELSIAEFYSAFEESLLHLFDLARAGDYINFEEYRIRLCEYVRGFLPNKPIDHPDIEETITIYSALTEPNFYNLMLDNLAYLTPES